MRLPANPLVLIGPTILCVFAVCFLLFWFSDKNRRHLLLFAIANLLFCLGSLSQMLLVPAGAGPNAVMTALIYTFSVLLVCDGLLRRSGKFMASSFYAVVLFLIVGGIAYFFYIDRSLVVRIYILNFGFGSIFLYTVWRLHSLRSGTIPERVLFWLTFAFAFQFFIRTTLTTGGIPSSGADFGQTAFWLALQYSLAVFGVSLALALLAVVVSDKIAALKYENAIDPLTGLLNRRGFDERAERVLEKLHDWPVTVLVVDIDHFKSVNDMFGHSIGDAVLRTIGTVLKGSLRHGDIGGRLGGEEFALVLRGCDLIAARTLANQLRTSINQTYFEGLSERRSITVSIGIASARDSESVHGLISRADRSLYRAKNAGRDRVDIDWEDFADIEAR